MPRSEPVAVFYTRRIRMGRICGCASDVLGRRAAWGLSSAASPGRSTASRSPSAQRCRGSEHPWEPRPRPSEPDARLAAAWQLWPSHAGRWQAWRSEPSGIRHQENSEGCREACVTPPGTPGENRGLLGARLGGQARLIRSMTELSAMSRRRRPRGSRQRRAAGAMILPERVFGVPGDEDRARLPDGPISLATWLRR